MNKQEYMEALAKALEEFDEGIRKEIIEGYEEHFAVGAANGKTEEQIVAELGSIEELVNDLKDLSGQGQTKADDESIGKDIEEMAKHVVKSVANFIGTMAGTITKNAGKVTESVFDGAGSFAESFAAGFEHATETVINKSSEFAKEVANSYKAAAGTAEKEAKAEDEAADDADSEGESEPKAEVPTEGSNNTCANVVAETDCGDIVITASDDGMLHANYENNGNENQQLAYKFDFKEKGDTFYVSVKKQSGNTFFFKSLPTPDITLYISVPAEIQAVTARSMSGDIKADVVVAGSLELTTMSGDIKVNSVQVSGEYINSTMSGDIVAENIDALTADVKSMSGDARFNGAAKVIKLSSTSGDARLKAHGAEKVTSTSISGDVRIELYEADGFRADEKSTSGDVTLVCGEERYTEAKNAQYTLGDGSVEVVASSVSGDVSVKVVE